MLTGKTGCTLYFLYILAGLYQSYTHADTEPPQITVVIVLDQCGHYQLNRLKPFFKYGFKELLSQGVVYEHAVHPHGMPGTSAGHSSMSTGTTPRDHGAISNEWIDKTGKTVAYGDDNRITARIFEPQDDGYKPSEHGASCHHTMVDGLSDQFVFSTTKQLPRKAFSFSLKMRSAVATAHKLGKAIWFDEESGVFTSSKAYYHHDLPAWLTSFNKHMSAHRKEASWPLSRREDDPAYDFPFIRDYEHASRPFPLADTKKTKFYSSSPQSSHDLCTLALSCIEHTLDKQDRTQMLIWLCLSNLDLVGHIYGPDSLDSIDLLYHLDEQIGSFMHNVQALVGSDNVMFILTADHGVEPIPEISAKKGFTQARRILTASLVQSLNKMIEQRYGAKDIVASANASFFYLNKTIFHQLPFDRQQDILNSLKEHLASLPGIKDAWTAQELASMYCEPGDLRQFYKNHLFAGRSADLICQPRPYVQLTKYPAGTSHDTPYSYNTHVPLVFYRKGALSHATVKNRAWIPQMSITIAQLLNLPRPSASTYEALALS